MNYSFKAAKLAKKPLTDLASYPVLTEEVGFPPSPLAKQGGTPAPGGGGGGSLGQMVSKAVNDVLGWKVKPGDTKGLMGALTQSFTLTEVEGRIESKWTPRTYAIQTDLSGGLTGAQASVYSRGKVALEQSLPLLDGLYKLDPEAVDEDIVALKSVVKSQMTELVNELGFLGGPRVSRVNQYFNLLLGSNTFPANPKLEPHPLGNTDPDVIQGTLGNLRDELGLSFTHQDFVNSVEDETDLSNFRIISDYFTSLAQTWLNNVGFVVLNTKTPFFGTQLVLLSRQLSVLAESVDEVRFTLDSVFIGPSERQTTELRFHGHPNLAPIFLEDLLSWIHDFAAEEGPRLIQDGGKFGVQNTFHPVVDKLKTIVTLLPSVHGLPPGFYTNRVQLSIADLSDQLTDMARLAKPIEHDITPEPDFGLPLAVKGVDPNEISESKAGTQLIIRGSGYQFGGGAPGIPNVYFQKLGSSTVPPPVSSSYTYFRSEGLLVIALGHLIKPSSIGLTHGMWNVGVSNPNSTYIAWLESGLTVTH
jgi:hypothetical protein